MFSYKLQKNFGAVYDRANLLFSPDGTRLYSPCGNKIMSFNIQNSDSQALPLKILYNIDKIDLNPTGNLMIVVNEKSQLLIVSMVSNTVLHRKDFQEMGKIYDLKFSPNGKYYAVCGSKQINVYHTPGFALPGGNNRLFTPFKIKQIIRASNEEMTSISWNGSSQLLMVTSKDFTMRVYPIDEKLAERCKPLSLTAHNDLIVGSFFSSDPNTPLNMYSISRNGQLFAWEANYRNFDAIFAEGESRLLNYKIVKKKYLFEDIKEVHSSTKVTSFAYKETTKLLVIGFSNGQFLLYELPDMCLIHAREIATKGPITSVIFNKKGSLIALGSGVGLGTKYDIDKNISNSTHLIVWDWQSESYLLKQSGYSNNISNSYECFGFSNTGETIVTGSTDGTIKVWNRQSGFSNHTFKEHKGPVTGLEFVPNKNGKVFVSCSLDGTVKVHDLNRYRTFRTLSAPNEEKPAQFICLAIDKISGDFIAAGSHNMFEIHLWSLKTGRIMDILSGHEGPVSSLKFSAYTNTLYSSSWDSSARIWNVFEGSNCTKEIIKLGQDALDLAFRPDGMEFAVCTLNGVISFFNAHSGEQIGIGIEGKEDLGVTRYSGEVVNDKYKYFRSIAYSVDGEYIIAGGNSKFICLYNCKSKLLVKKFEILSNLSLDGYEEFVSKRKIQEFGFNLSLLRHRQNNDGNAPISLPGVKKSDFADRSLSPTVAVHQIEFSSTMRSFVFVSTEGVSLYSIDSANVFDPFELEADITPLGARQLLALGNYQTALLQALKLQDEPLIRQTVETVPVNEIRLLVDGLANKYVHKLVEFFAASFAKTKHVEFYMKWISCLLTQKGLQLKNHLPNEVFGALISNLYTAVSQNSSHLSLLCRNVRFATKFMDISCQQNGGNLMEIECD